MHCCYQRFWQVWMILVCAIPGASGQALRASPASAAAGQFAIVEIAFQPKQGQQVVALQFDAVIPRQLEVDTRSLPRLLLAVKNTGKLFNCAVPEKTADSQRLRCIVAGGQKAIPAGPLAVLTLKVPEKAPPGAVHIRFEQALAVLPDLKQLPIDPSEGVVTIRAGQ